MAEKMAEAPPSPQKKKCCVNAQSPFFKISNNPKPCAKKEDVASLDDASEGGDGKGISFRSDQPNLHHATKEQLMAALKMITDKEQDAKEEVVGDDGYNKVSDDGEYKLHGGGVSSGSCARSSSRIHHQTKFYADGNDNDNDCSDNDSSDKGESIDGEEDNLDDPTCDELNNDGNDEDATDDNNDATDDNDDDDDNNGDDDDDDNDDDDDDRDDRLSALKAKIHKEKLCRRRENSASVLWKGRSILLGSSIPKTQAIEMKEHAKAQTKEWRSMQPNPTKEWVILELERLNICKLHGNSTSLISDELKARKEVAEVSIFN